MRPVTGIQRRRRSEVRSGARVEAEDPGSGKFEFSERRFVDGRVVGGGGKEVFREFFFFSGWVGDPTAGGDGGKIGGGSSDRHRNAVRDRGGNELAARRGAVVGNGPGALEDHFVGRRAGDPGRAFFAVFAGFAVADKNRGFSRFDFDAACFAAVFGASEGERFGAGAVGSFFAVADEDRWFGRFDFDAAFGAAVFGAGEGDGFGAGAVGSAAAGGAGVTLGARISLGARRSRRTRRPGGAGRAFGARGAFFGFGRGARLATTRVVLVGVGPPHNSKD